MIELLVVVALLMVIGTIPLMVLNSASKKVEKQNHAFALKAALDRVRADSMRRDGGSSVTIKGNGFDVNGVAPTLGTSGGGNAGSIVTSISSDAGTVIAHPDSDATVLPVTIAFDRKGRLVASSLGQALVRPAFIVCSAACSDGGGADRYVISITSMGIVSISKTGDETESIPQPVRTSVPASASVNSDMPIVQSP